jgi:hypothetical protein
MRFLFAIGASAALVVVALVAYLNLAGADVVVTNSGPQTVRVRGAMPAAAESALVAAGVRVPDELRPGEPTLVRVPRLSGLIKVNAAPGAIDVSLLGQTLHIAATCDRLELDGATLLGRSTGFDLGASARHDVQFACR